MKMSLKKVFLLEGDDFWDSFGEDKDDFWDSFGAEKEKEKEMEKKPKKPKKYKGQKEYENWRDDTPGTTPVMNLSNIDFRNNVGDFVYKATGDRSLSELYREHVENLQTWLSSYEITLDAYEKKYGKL